MMTEQDIDEKTSDGPTAPGDEPSEAETDLVRAEQAAAGLPPEPPQPGEPGLPTQLGAARYVLAGFFAVGITVTFLVAKVFVGTWNRLADNTWVARQAPFVSSIAEDDRSTYATLLGVAVGVSATIYAYRRPDVRTWTSEVAAELAKVTWPSKKEVTNSTIVVIAAGAFATVFLALLDRFWGFVTNLVYGS
jgi:preprotein translocase subunit SecE